jgi:sialate O-acetylesterase
VPVGLIVSAVGGTIAEKWISPEAFAADRELWRGEAFLRSTGTTTGNVIDQMTKRSQHYNGMIAPLARFPIRGAIWYQGESNAGIAHEYRTLMTGLIADWRRAWGLGDFPFYYVQIAPYNYGGGDGPPLLRQMQLDTLAVANTGMAVTSDVGDPSNIHPARKQPVGRRLALWALANTYGRDLVYSGPRYESMTVEGDAIRINFRHSAGLKTSDGQAPDWFTIAGADRNFVTATAAIEGETVVVRAAAVPHPVAVRLGWAHVADQNLRNGADLPASPFRTDTWPTAFEARDDAVPALDADGDGLSDPDEEYVYGTDKLLADTDGDGYDDGAEVRQHRTNPLDAADHPLNRNAVHGALWPAFE